MEISWLVGQANVGIERVLPGRHIKQSEWQSGWNNVFEGPNHYDYISDYECVFPFPVNVNGLGFPANPQLEKLQQQKQQGTAIPIIHIAHFTKAAGNIIATGGFTGGPKQINLVQGRFSWWSPIFDENAKDTVRHHLGQVINPFLDNNDDMQVLKNQFATSKAFHINPWQYGTYRNVYFKYSIEDMCRSYANYIGPNEVIQFKVLGTFLYKQEIMHAVVVCSQTDGAGLFKAYPPVPTPDEEGAVVTRDANTGNWVWKPQATATEIVRLNRFAWVPYPRFRRWENVAFALYLPGIGDHVDYIAVEDLENNKYEIVSPPGSVPGSVYPPGYGVYPPG